MNPLAEEQLTAIMEISKRDVNLAVDNRIKYGHNFHAWLLRIDCVGDVSYDYMLHRFICDTWHPIDRNCYLDILNQIMTVRARQKTGSKVINWPHILMFYEIGDYARSALGAVMMKDGGREGLR